MRDAVYTAEIRLSLQILKGHREEKRETMQKSQDDDAFTIAGLLADILPFDLSSQIEMLMMTLVLLTDGADEYWWKSTEYSEVIEALWKVRNRIQAEENSARSASQSSNPNSVCGNASPPPS